MILDASTQHVIGLDLHFELPEWLYVARTGSACIEVGDSLECLTEGSTDTWEPGGEDVATWLHAQGVCQLVALVRDDQGSASVVFLEGVQGCELPDLLTCYREQEGIDTTLRPADRLFPAFATCMIYQHHFRGRLLGLLAGRPKGNSG